MGQGISTTGGTPSSTATTNNASNTNQRTSSSSNPTSHLVPDFLAELGGEVHYERSMGTSSRFLKTIRGRHLVTTAGGQAQGRGSGGALVVKVFVKPDTTLSLKSIHRRLKAEREGLSDCTNVLAYQKFVETERAGYILRQWVASNLYDRISTRPFLTSIEKRWIAFQLLVGLQSARERNISHGDIKTENVVVTSWNWVYLTDFASFKPTHLPLDDPSTFSYYFDTSSRRTCYLAPERFFPVESEATRKKTGGLPPGEALRDGKVTEEMDVFSLGCVLAEVWMEGTAPFTLSQLFKYREGEYSPETYLAEIEDVEIRTLIRSMISLDPANRSTCSEYLASYRSTAFPEIFYTFLHPFLSSLNDSAVSNGHGDADEKIEKVWTEWETIAGFLDEGREPVVRAAKKREHKHSIFPLKLHLPGFEGDTADFEEASDGPALILLSLVCSNIRNCLRPASILKALDVLLGLNRYLSDETKLDRLVPYLVALLQDDVASVRTAALKTLTQTLMLVTSIAPSNATIFAEYVLPNTKPLATDVELLPRTTYAQCISSLALTAKRFLEMTEAMKTEGTFKMVDVNEFDGSPYETSYDASLQELQAQIQEHVNPLLSDASSVVKRALLYHVAPLCGFFGRVKANDVILSHLVTYLNTRDWELRAAFNECAVELASCVGPRSLEEYLLPLITLSLADAEEFVVIKVLATLSTLTERKVLAKAKIWELVTQIIGFLCHPNIWIRKGTATFLASCATVLQPTDRWCIFYPMVKRLLRADILEMTAAALLENAREPLPRVIFEAAVTWASRSNNSHFWTIQRTAIKGAPRDASVRTDEDHAQLEKMRQLGMKPEDEYKLTAMREYISKLATSRQGSRSVSSDTPIPQDSSSILQEPAIVPQTIFFSLRSTSDDQYLSPAPSSFESRQPTSRITSDSTWTRRFSFDTPRPAPGSLGSISSRQVSAQQPLDDLRRRLALAGGASSTTVNSMETTTQHAAVVDSSDRASSVASNDDLSDTTPSLRTDIVAPQPRSKVKGNGVEVGRATVAIGQDSTTVMGSFNVETRYRNEEDGAGSGGDTPSSMGGRGKRSVPRFTSTYEGHDPIIQQLIERSYVDSYREPILELGAHVAVGIPRRKALRNTSLPNRERNPTRPEGTLIAHLVEHKAAVTAIAVSPDQLFFVSGSRDGTVKVWDTIRLEKNVTSKSRQTIVQGGKITSVVMIENSHCVASASDNGTVWIHRVDVGLAAALPKYNSRPNLIREYRVEEEGDFVTCLISYTTPTSSALILGMSTSSIVMLDVRTMSTMNVLLNPRHFGPISSMCIDRKRVWIVVGTSAGVLSLWDLRFGLLLRSWSVGKRGVHRIELHPSKGKNRWIIVSLEDTRGEEEPIDKLGTLVAEVWDIDRGAKVEEYRIIAPGQMTVSRTRFDSLGYGGANAHGMIEAVMEPAKAIEALLVSAANGKAKGRTGSTNMRLPTSFPTSETTNPLDSLRSHRPEIKAFLVGNDYGAQYDGSRGNYSIHHSGELIEADGGNSKRDTGFMISAGEDRKIRYWNLASIDGSAVISGLDLEEEKPIFSTHNTHSLPLIYTESPPSSSSSRRSNPSSPGANKVHRSTLIANSQQQLLRGHREAITALALIELPFKCVVSGDRSGCIKVFE